MLGSACREHHLGASAHINVFLIGRTMRQLFAVALAVRYRLHLPCSEISKGPLMLPGHCGAGEELM